MTQMGNEVLMGTGHTQTRDPMTYAVIGAAMEVHRELGCGFLETVYQEALGLEFESRVIPFVPQPELRILYKEIQLAAFYRPDFICFGDVVVELKALKELTGSEESQILNYLKVSGMKTGLLLNFGASRLEYKRFVC